MLRLVVLRFHKWTSSREPQDKCPILRNVLSFQEDSRGGQTPKTIDRKVLQWNFFFRFMPFLHLLLLIVCVCMCVCFVCMHVTTGDTKDWEPRTTLVVFLSSLCGSLFWNAANATSPTRLKGAHSEGYLF